MEFELSLTLRESGKEPMPPAKWAWNIESNPSVHTLGLSLAQDFHEIHCCSLFGEAATCVA